MDVEEFKLDRYNLDLKIKFLENKFISENCPLNVGDRIMITAINGTKRIAFVTDLFVNRDGKFWYHTNKSKKDGSKSKHSDYIYHNETFEKITDK